MDIKTFAKEHFEEYQAFICKLTSIPAPSHHEERRAAFICEYLHQLGYDQAFIDDAKNVICEVKGSDLEAPVHIFMAHTDTVFPDETELPVVVEDGCIKAPGVGDDTTNVCAILMTLKYLSEKKIVPKQTMVFALNSCEEGLGNLKGSRRIVQDYGSRIREFYTFDGTNLRRVVTSAVGSHRYRVTVRTEGGHSYGAFGNRNAIYYLSSIINTIYTMKVPQKEGVKTTYNVGVIEGGTSVNTIAQEASMLCEYRSNDRECLETMRVFFEKTFEAYRAMGVEVEVTLVGDRPCGGDVPQEKLDALIARADSAVRELFDAEPIHGPSSTDANIPLAAGIPAICVSAAVGRGCHTRQEEIDLDQLPNGAKLSMRLMQEYFEI